MKTYKVGYLIGSLAKESINRKLAQALFKLAPPQLVFEEIRFADLPIYSYDYDADYPEVGRMPSTGPAARGAGIHSPRSRRA